MVNWEQIANVCVLVSFEPKFCVQLIKPIKHVINKHIEHITIKPIKNENKSNWFLCWCQQKSLHLVEFHLVHMKDLFNRTLKTIPFSEEIFHMHQMKLIQMQWIFVDVNTKIIKNVLFLTF